MDHAGSNVSLTVSSTSLTLVSLDTGQLIAMHDMPRISFASGGDTVSFNYFINKIKFSNVYIFLLCIITNMILSITKFS